MLWIFAFLFAVLDVTKRYKADAIASRKVRGLISVNLDAVRWGYDGATPPIDIERHVADIPKDTTELVSEGLRTVNYSVTSSKANAISLPPQERSYFSESTVKNIEDSRGFEASSEIFTRTERSFGGSKAEPPSRPNSYWDDPHFRPFFDNGTERNVTAQLGKTAYLHCRIRQLGDRTVSWVRQKDLHILTVGKYTYTSDQRFTSIHLENSDDWTLEIKYTQKKDAGIYECQVSTEPKMSLSIMLNVVVAKAAIPEGPNMYIHSGSTINLTCVITESTSPPVYVFWYHDDRMINYDSIRGGIKVNTEKGPTTVSRLQIFTAQQSDSGNYSCIPSYADPANITVHVLNGEKPAAMQHGRQTNLTNRVFSSPFLLTLLLLVLRGGIVQR